jgi:type 1 glutamine amidotransferase
MTVRAKILSLFLFAGFVSLSGAAPIRVGIFKSVGPNRYFHTNIHTAGSAIVTMLANPSAADLGPNLIIPKDGFVVTLFGVRDTVTSTGAPARTATDAQQAAFISALDTLDVVVFPSLTDFGGSMPDPSRRSRLLEFFQAKGVVSIHGSIDTYSTWPSWDSIHGTRFQNWTSNDRLATLHLDTASKGDPNLGLLNRGLPDTARFFEEWMSFTTNGNVIRANAGLKVTVNIDESSYDGGMGGARAMGADHPMSWFREFSGGGRFFFTALGHRAQHYLGTGATNYVRRQLYNAVLWAAGADSNGVVGVRPAGATRAGKGPEVRVSRSEIHVRVAEETPFTVDIHALDGRRIASRQGRKAGTLVFNNCAPHAVYLVTVTTPHSRASRRVLLN